MAARPKSLRVIVRVAVVAGTLLAFRSATGCNSADYVETGPCTGPTCTCEQDPTLPRCKGFNARPETGADLPEGSFPDAGVPDATPTEAGDSGDVDAAEEAG